LAILYILDFVAFGQIVFGRPIFIHLFATLFLPFFLLDFGKAVFKLFVLLAGFDKYLSPMIPLKTDFNYKTFSHFYD
jgi:hypothetical protein